MREKQKEIWADFTATGGYAACFSFFHLLKVDNSGATYGTTPANFNAQLSAIKQSGLTVETLNQALNEVLLQVTK